MKNSSGLSVYSKEYTFLVLLCTTKFHDSSSLHQLININKELQFIMVSPGILPPQPHVASLLPPLEQKLQQWNVPLCGCMPCTHTWNGLPCYTQSQIFNYSNHGPDWMERSTRYRNRMDRKEKEEYILGHNGASCMDNTGSRLIK